MNAKYCILYLYLMFLSSARAQFETGIRQYLSCYFQSECCSRDFIPRDIELLDRQLSEKLYGQHIVKNTLISVLSSHKYFYRQSRKPLVISLHGTPGTGKNFVSEHIANALYKNGMKSKYVHKYMGRADFPYASRVNEYKEKVNNEIRAAIKDCPFSLFIFDEVDQIPKGVFESLTSLVDYHSYVDGADSTQAIFLFLSNTGGVQISNKLAELMELGVSREDVTSKDFETLLKTSAYNVVGGLQGASLIDSHVIDFYLPFLPMGKPEVIQCIQSEFRSWGIKSTPEKIIKVLDDSITYDPVHGLFAVTGCKTLEKRISAYYKH